MFKNYIVGVDKGHPEGSRTVYTEGIVMNKRFKVVACGLNLPDKETMKKIRSFLIKGEKNESS
jgi:hypothetical protein